MLGDLSVCVIYVVLICLETCHSMCLFYDNCLCYGDCFRLRLPVGWITGNL